MTVRLPSLAERASDILLLAEHFLGRACADYGLGPKTLTPDARAALLAYAWPGNIRELANLMERVTLLTETSRVTVDALGLPAAPGPRGTTADERERTPPFRDTMGTVEREHLLQALRETDWNIARAAARLQIPRGTLRYRIEKLELRRSGSPPARSRPPVPGSTPELTPPLRAGPARGAPSWERRQLAFLRAVLVPASNGDAGAEIVGALQVLVEKAESFGGRVEELGPLGMVAAFGLEAVEDAPHRLARIATFRLDECLGTGDWNEAVRFGQEALSLARTLGDRATEVVATSFLGVTHAFRGEFGDAATLLERNVVALEGDLRYERFGTAFVHSVVSEANLADVLSQLGRSDEAIEHAEAAVRIAEAADHPLSLFTGLRSLGLAHLRRGDLPRATPVLERCHDHSRTSQFVTRTPIVAAALGAAYVLAGRAEEALPLVAGAVEEFSRRPNPIMPALILLCAGMTCLSAGRIDEAWSHAREALALSRRLGARGSEAHALCLAGDVASMGGAADADGYYHEALALASQLGMRPLVAHCHLGLGTLAGRTGDGGEAREHLTTAAAMYREMGMDFWLAKAEAAIVGIG